MKNTLILLLLAFSGVVIGQNTEAYVTYGTQFLSYNTPASDQYFDSSNTSTKWPINYSVKSQYAAPQNRTSYISSKGIISVGYNVRNGRHTIGGLFNYERQNIAYVADISTLGNSEIGIVDGEIVIISPTTEPASDVLDSWSDSDIKTYTLAARYDYNWIFKDKLKVYSGLSLGAGIRSATTQYFQSDILQTLYPAEELENLESNKSNEMSYHFHANIAGLRFGHIWSVVAEVGIGNRGLVNLGVNHLLFASPKWIDKKAAKKAAK